MDKDKIILSILMSVLIDEYKYKPTQITNAMGEKYEKFLSWGEKVNNEEFNKDLEKTIYELFLEYVNLL